MKITNKIKILLFIIFFLLAPLNFVRAAAVCPTDDPCRDRGDLNEKISCYTNIVNICKSQRESMSSQVSYLNNKIELTNSQIEKTKETIAGLEDDIERIGGKIDSIEEYLTIATGKLIDRVKAVYKYGDSSYLDLILETKKLSDLVSRFKYLQTVQAHDRKLLVQLQNSKVNFQEQKTVLEDKKTELDKAKKELERDEALIVKQKKEKEIFLEVTKNSERIYKQNLAASQREASEIQKAASILSQAGVGRKVNKGDTVGIMGNTGFSTGAHLHFAVYNLKESELGRFSFDVGYDNPFNYLANRQLLFVANSCNDVGQNTTKGVGGGSWDWPMANPKITQCYGQTPFSNAYYRSGIHNGIDMVDDGNPLIRAVDSGTAYAYKGGQASGNGVFIFHDNGKMTLYWHLQD